MYNYDIVKCRSMLLLLLLYCYCYYFNRKLRKKDIAKYHVQLSLAMAFMLLVNIVLLILNDKNVKEPYEVCVTVSVLVHYFTLVAVMWMGAEALLMFQKLVIVFRQITKTFIVFISVICWSKCFLIFYIIHTCLIHNFLNCINLYNQFQLFPLYLSSFPCLLNSLLAKILRSTSL